MSSLSGGARRATGARRKEAGQLEQHLLIQKPGWEGGGRNYIETTTATATRKYSKPIFWRRAHMSSLSGGARRATGARRKEAGQLEQHLLIQSITNGLALATGQEDGYCVSRLAKGPWHTCRGAAGPGRKEPSAKRSPVQSTTVHPATSPACGTLLGGRDCAEA